MDKAQAKIFAAQLIQEGALDEWRVIDFLGHGKSAVVMRGEKDDFPPVAIKVFHPELIERFGLDRQMERISREQALIGKNHVNAVRILGGGLSKQHNRPYIVMSLEEGEVLSDCLMKIPKQNIRHIVSQLASAARFLEELGFAHRDIKPENIILTDLDACNIKILDFGVLRPVGASSLTDGPEHTPFVGTHQYSPPEMLHRTEEQTSEAWRAITFYQIGAVIHDLLTQRPLFEEDKEPYANLVVAVDTKYPEFDVTIEDRELVGLAKRCLLKKPSDRLELVQWQDFLFKNKEAFDSKDERLTRLVRLQKTRLAEQPLQPLERREINRLAQRRAGELITVLRTRVESVLDEFAGKLPPRVITVEQIFYPSITLCCNFVKDKTLAFDKNLNIQLALKRADGSSAVQVYVRSAEATVAVPDWLCLGGFTADLFGLNEAFANWLLGVLEKILEA